MDKVIVEARELLRSEYSTENMMLACEGPDAIEGAWIYRRDEAALRAIEKALSSRPIPTEEQVRQAFEAHRRRPFAEVCEPSPDSFTRTETGQAYRSPHLQAAFQEFAAGYHASLSVGVREREESGVPADAGQPALVAGAPGAASAGVSAHTGDGQAQGSGR